MFNKILKRERERKEFENCEFPEYWEIAYATGWCSMCIVQSAVCALDNRWNVDNMKF